ncbi:alcohol dehydrogenase catalytic domain-containing protein [Leucobacter weissii]|uniref:Alcohol dehydrogenase catalytic domain-containing protein n=1 Tax=Leucobacter weissii TaxID=1983706 RepID=A0A939S7Z9_9MICO|nr:alcohol dehydrogenase catalytic domain-containing protein [Leucobacter weissii]MBO1901511.1 alcohol dehydrogenase catalytic domain-containing protein [Leucobacter weissii]
MTITTDAVPDTMRAAVYHGNRDIRFETVPAPSAGPGELLLRTGTVGVCGSDLGEFAHGPLQHPVEVAHPHTGHLGPIVPGHEFSGTVIAVGDGVSDEWVGKTVASCGSVCCGECGPCRRGESNLCTTYSGVGLHRNGALGEYVSTPVEACIAVDELGLSMDEAALCQPMAIAVHNVRRVGDVNGETVLLTGAGGIGAFLAYVLTQLGAKAIVVDRDERRLAIAEELGAYRTVLVDGADDRARIRQAVEGEDVRLFLEATGVRPVLDTVLAISPKGARIVAIGIQHAPVEIDLAALTLMEKTLIGSNALVREVDFPIAVDLVARRRGRWSIVAPRVLPLDRLVSDALVPMSEGRASAIKILVDPSAAEIRDSETG